MYHFLRPMQWACILGKVIPIFCVGLCISPCIHILGHGQNIDEGKISMNEIYATISISLAPAER